MTDRELLELLELAAKAAGLNFSWNDRLECGEVWQDGDRIKRFWQPHRDDGDALRLAVKLKIEIVISDHSATAIVDMIGCSEPLGADHDAATRRAIVRAAAEIGRQTA